MLLRSGVESREECVSICLIFDKDPLRKVEVEFINYLKVYLKFISLLFLALLEDFDQFKLLLNYPLLINDLLLFQLKCNFNCTNLLL